jgi:hypothetical protein
MMSSAAVIEIVFLFRKAYLDMLFCPIEIPGGESGCHCEPLRHVQWINTRSARVRSFPLF